MAEPGLAPMTPARLAVGLVSAGRVGTAVGSAWERRGHVVSGLVARSPASRERAARAFPEARVGTPAEVAQRCELLLLAVPDSALPALVRELDAAGAVRSGHIVVHTAGALGWGVLRPFHDRGAVVVAAHPAMTFTGGAADLDRLDGCPWAVTGPDEVAQTVGQMLVLETGGQPRVVDESMRGLYHAALAHGANHLVTLVADALDALSAALAVDPRDGPGQGGWTQDGPVHGTDARPGSTEDAARMLGPLLHAALDNVLALGDRALTGPVMRGDAATVARHLDVLEAFDGDLAAGYRALALRTAQRCHAGPDLTDLLAPVPEEHPR